MLVGGRKGVGAFRAARFPGRAGRASGLRSRFGAGGRASRRAAGDRAGHDRTLCCGDWHKDVFERAYWALAAQRNTRILGVFTRLWKRDGKPHYRSFQPRMWGLLERDLDQPHLAPVRGGSTQTSLPTPRVRRGSRPREPGQASAAPARRSSGGGAAHRDDHGGGARQEDATPDRHPAQAADCGGRQGAARSRARKAASGGGQKGRWSTSIISPTRWRRISRPGIMGSRSSISDERDLLLETGGGLVRAAPLIDSDPFLALNSDNLWVDGPVDTLQAAGLAMGRGEDGRAAAARAPGPGAQPQGHGRLPHGPPGPLAAARAQQSRRSSSPASRWSPSACSRDAPEGPFSTNILWDRAIEEGRCFGAVHQGLWFDVGTPAVDPA